MTNFAKTPDSLCPLKGRQIEQAWVDHRAGDERAFLDLVGSIYDWLDRRVATILRGYPGLGLPAEEVLSDCVLDWVARSLTRYQAATCEEFVRLVSGEVRYAIRDVFRERARHGMVSLSAAGPEEGDADWLADPRAANPVEALLAREEGEQFARARARFDEAAASLFEPLRQTLCLRYYAGLPLATVAAEMGVAEKTVRNRVKEALDTISMNLTGKPFPGKPPQFKGAGSDAEAHLRCRSASESSLPPEEVNP